MSIEAMKMALETLESNQPVNYCENAYGERSPIFLSNPLRFEINAKAIAALRQAIKDEEERFRPDYDTNAILLERIRELEAQLEKEPVAWMHEQGDYKEPSLRKLDDEEISRGWEQYPLYTAHMSTKQENIDTKSGCVDSVDIEPVMNAYHVYRVPLDGIGTHDYDFKTHTNIYRGETPSEEFVTLYRTSPKRECTRSHPHENMDAMCELRTEIARLTHKNATLEACLVQMQNAALDMSIKPENIDTKTEHVDGVNIDLLRQSEQEGWRWAKECEAEVKRLKEIIDELENDDPPKREWQGLTVKEIFHADNAGQGLIEFARAIEAKLKEKNNG